GRRVLRASTRLVGSVHGADALRPLWRRLRRSRRGQAPRRSRRRTRAGGARADRGDERGGCARRSRPMTYLLYTALLAAGVTAYAPVALARRVTRGVPLNLKARLGLGRG